MPLLPSGAEPRPAAPNPDDLPLRDAPTRERVRWGTIAGAIWGAGLAIAAIGLSDARDRGFWDAEVPTFEAPIPVAAMLGFALLVLPLVGGWVGLLLPLTRRPWGGAAIGVLGALPIVASLAAGLPWRSFESASTKLGLFMAMAALAGGWAFPASRIVDVARATTESAS